MFRLQHYLTLKLLKQVYYSSAYPIYKMPLQAGERHQKLISIKLKFSKIDLFVSCAKPINKK